MRGMDWIFAAALCAQSLALISTAGTLALLMIVLRRKGIVKDEDMHL